MTYMENVSILVLMNINLSNASENLSAPMENVSILVLMNINMYFQENPLFTNIKEIFLDIKIAFFCLIFFNFCRFFSIFRNS